MLTRGGHCWCHKEGVMLRLAQPQEVVYQVVTARRKHLMTTRLISGQTGQTKEEGVLVLGLFLDTPSRSILMKLLATSCDRTQTGNRYMMCCSL